jgi:hypothetical protein
MLSRTLLSCLLLAGSLALAACGGEETTEEENNQPQENTNNDTANNGAVNNGAVNNGAANNGAVNNDAANNDANNDAANNAANNGELACGDSPAYYEDGDGDGFGEGDSLACGTEPSDAYATQGGDCAGDDAWRNPASYEVCGDNLDDDCDGSDMDCPTTQASGMDLPDWDCQGEPPSNVYAWASFEDGNGYFQDGACFVFFEGLPGEFYVQHNVQRAGEDCSQDRNGCTCPSLNGWPSYDRRLYAFTLQGDTESCPEVSLRDHAGEEQVVSNACRKYLYQMHAYDIPYSFVAGSQEAVDARIDAFPTVEVACAEDAPHANLPYATLMTGQIVKNPDFQPAN